MSENKSKSCTTVNCDKVISNKCSTQQCGDHCKNAQCPRHNRAARPKGSARRITEGRYKRKQTERSAETETQNDNGQIGPIIVNNTTQPPLKPKKSKVKIPKDGFIVNYTDGTDTWDDYVDRLGRIYGIKIYQSGDNIRVDHPRLALERALSEHKIHLIVRQHSGREFNDLEIVNLHGSPNRSKARKRVAKRLPEDVIRISSDVPSSEIVHYKMSSRRCPDNSYYRHLEAGYTRNVVPIIIDKIWYYQPCQLFDLIDRFDHSTMYASFHIYDDEYVPTGEEKVDIFDNRVSVTTRGNMKPYIHPSLAYFNTYNEYHDEEKQVSVVWDQVFTSGTTRIFQFSIMEAFEPLGDSCGPAVYPGEDTTEYDTPAVFKRPEPVIVKQLSNQEKIDKVTAKLAAKMVGAPLDRETSIKSVAFTASNYLTVEGVDLTPTTVVDVVKNAMVQGKAAEKQLITDISDSQPKKTGVVTRIREKIDPTYDQEMDNVKTVIQENTNRLKSLNSKAPGLFMNSLSKIGSAINYIRRFNAPMVLVGVTTIYIVIRYLRNRNLGQDGVLRLSSPYLLIQKLVSFYMGLRSPGSAQHVLRSLQEMNTTLLSPDNYVQLGTATAGNQ
jgi:hypothetical protein